MKEYFKLVSAVHLLLIKDGKILLLRRANTGYEDGSYSVVAGHLDGRETVTAAMVREAQEEAGITIQPMDFDVVHVMHRITDRESIDFFLTTKQWKGEIVNKEPHKCDDLSWFDLDTLPQNIIPYVRSAIDHYRQGVFFSEFGWRS